MHEQKTSRCEDLCTHMPGCHSVDMHRAKNRCFLNALRALVLRGGGVIFCYLSISFSAVSRPNFTSKYSFFSIFQDLQDPHTFAPLHIQNLQIFSNFSLKNDEFSRFLQIFGEICSNLRFFAQIFTEFCRNCGNVK